MILYSNLLILMVSIIRTLRFERLSEVQYFLTIFSDEFFFSKMIFGTNRVIQSAKCSCYKMSFIWLITQMRISYYTILRYFFHMQTYCFHYLLVHGELMNLLIPLMATSWFWCCLLCFTIHMIQKQLCNIIKIPNSRFKICSGFILIDTSILHTDN